MKAESYLTNVSGTYRYILCNENLKIGDNVFPIIGGRYENGEMLFHSIDFPINFNDPHIITENKPDSEYIRTDKGYSHKPRYFKIIKIEQQMKDSSQRLIRHNWVEIPLEILQDDRQRK